MDMIIRCVGIILLAVCTYVIVPAIKDWRQTKLTSSQQEQLTFWVTMGVQWAKQWMQSSTGEEKKEAVLAYVHQKVKELKLPYTDEDIDKAIESVYSTVKDVVNAAAGTVVINASAPDPAKAE